MDSLFLWELGTPKVYLIWLLVLAAQIAVAEINRRWNWTIFAVWTVGGIALMPYAWIHGTPMVGWFPFGKVRDHDPHRHHDGHGAGVRETQPGEGAQLRDCVAWACWIGRWPSTSWRPTSAT